MNYKPFHLHNLESLIRINSSSEGIAAHWGYHLAGALTLLLFLVFITLTFIHYKKNKNNHYVENFSKMGWLINFYKKNKFQLYVFLDIILGLTSIVFFIAGSGGLS